MLYFLLIGTISSRMVSFGACRDGQRDVNHIAKLIKRWHHAGGGERDATLRKTKAEVVKHDFHGRNHVSQVQQRLAHPHHHHVGNRTYAGGLHRADDFRRAPDPPIISETRRLRLKPCWAVEQNLHSSAQPTGKKRTGWRDRLQDVHGFDALIANGNRPLDGAVARALLFHDFRRADLRDFL